MKKSQFIEPNDASAKAQAEAILLSGGWRNPDATYLAALMLAAEIEEFRPGFQHLRTPSDTHQLSPRMLAALEALCAVRPGASSIPEALVFAGTEAVYNEDLKMRGDLFSYALAAFQPRIDFEDLLRKLAAGLVAAGGKEALEQLARVANLFTNKPAQQKHGPWIDLGRIIDFAISDQRWPASGWVPEESSREAFKVQESQDISSPFFWYRVLGDHLPFDLCRRMIEHAPTREAASSIVRGINRSVCTDISRRRFGPNQFHLLLEDQRKQLQGIWSAYATRLSGSPLDQLEVCTWMRLARIVFEEREYCASPDEKSMIFKMAMDQSGQWRSVHRGRTIVMVTSQLHRELVEDVCILLFCSGSLWQAWKALLLAFRTVPEPTLGEDLGHGQEPASLWSAIPRAMAIQFHKHVHKELASDSQLNSFRSDFSRFCLDRLKTKSGSDAKSSDSDQELIEPDPNWRYAYVRAAHELRINPGGNGHHVLHRARSMDPDIHVQEAARAAYNDIRRGDTLGDMSPRRAVLYAFWWIAQAHMLALGQEIDPSGALGTRERMVRATS